MNLARLRGAAVAALLALAGCGQQGQDFRSTDITGAEFGRGFELVDHDGKRRTLEDFRGKVVLVFFGFTHCPDACPTTLARFKLALQKLGNDASRVQVLFVTVDPERDTPEVLKRYVTAFDPSFLGLTGSPEDIARTAEEFKVFYAKVAGNSPENYSMDHSAQTYVFDSQGRLRLYVSHAQGPDDLLHDIRQLLSTE